MEQLAQFQMKKIPRNPHWNSKGGGEFIDSAKDYNSLVMMNNGFISNDLKNGRKRSVL